MVLRAAWVMCLSSLRSSLRFQRSVDLNSRVLDSPCLMRSSALRWPRRYWSKRKSLTTSPKAWSSVMRLYRSKLESTISWITCSTLWLKVSRTFSRVFTRAAASRAASPASLSIIWPRVTRCLGPRFRPKRSFQRGDDPRQRLQLFRRRPGGVLGADGIEHARAAVEADPAAPGLLDPVRLHVYVPLHLARQFVPVGRQQAAQVPREDVQLLQVGVGKGQYLRKESVEPLVVGEQAPEFMALVPVEVLKTLHHRRERGIEPVLGDPGVEPDPGEAVHVALRVHRKRAQPGLDAVEQVGIGGFRQERGLVVGLEAILDRVRLVGEVEDHRAVFLRVRAIEPGKVCTAFTPPSFLSTYMVCSSGWSKPVWNFVGDDQEPVVLSLEGAGGLRLPQPVHPRLRVGGAAVPDGPGKRHERLERIAPLGQVFVHRQLVAHGVQARAGDDHGLGPAADPVLHPLGEVLHHDAHLLADGVGMKLDEGLQQELGLALVVARIVRDGLEQPPLGFVGRVVCQHVEDEPLSMAWRMLYRWKGANEPSSRSVPKSSSVLFLGVAVKAKVETLGMRPRFCISARIVFSSSSSGVSARDSSLSASSRDAGDSTALRLLVLSPDCDECASSTMRPKRFPGSSPISWAMTGNFWSVVTMMVLPDSSASLSWREVVSMFSTTPRVCSNCRTVAWSCRSSTRRSVMTTMVSKTRRSSGPCRVESWCASQAMVKLLPLPAECWMR